MQVFISYFRVYRPLTPPYMRFRIRRFLTRMQLHIVIHKTGVARTLQQLCGGNSVHKAMGCTTVTFTAVCPLPSLPLRDAALLQVLEARAYLLPTFPNTHADATAQPLVGFFQETAHVSHPKVGHPTSDELGQHLLAPRITDIPTAGGLLLEPLTQLGLCLRMDAQASLSLSCVEGVAKVLLPVHAAYMGLLAVHLQEQFLFDVTADAFADPFSGAGTLAENNAVVGIADKGQAAAFEFAVKLGEHGVAQYRGLKGRLAEHLAPFPQTYGLSSLLHASTCG